MTQAYELLFERLRSPEAIAALVGESESLHLECKQWSLDEPKKPLAKAVSGFANAEGGVIVIGLEARKGATDEPDVIQRGIPLADVAVVRSRIEELIPHIVEPFLEGVRVEAVASKAGEKTGFVVIGVPPTEGPPCRSRMDWKFYQRINSGCFPMEYFQIDAMWGKRSKPKLVLTHKVSPPGEINMGKGRTIELGISNVGRGLAHFPTLRIQDGVALGIRGMIGTKHGLPVRFSYTESLVFGGGIDDVIHSGATLTVATITQRAMDSGKSFIVTGRPQFTLSPMRLVVELAAEAMPMRQEVLEIPEDSLE